MRRGRAQAPCLRRAQPFSRWQPTGQRRAIGQPQAGQHRAVQHDAAALGAQGPGIGFGAKISQVAVHGLGRHQGPALAPEVIEGWHVVAQPRARVVARAVVDGAQPAHLVAAFAERRFNAQPVRQVAKDVVVVACLAHSCDGLLHRDHMGRAPVAGDVVALYRRGRGQHDVGAARAGGPHRVLHDDGLGPGPGAAQAVQILMVVKRVAAGPVHQPDVGVMLRLALVGEGLARVQQQVGDARDRDEVRVGLAQRRQLRRPARDNRPAHAAQRAVTVAHTAAGQADLADDGGQAQRGPERLLAMLGALQAPADGEHAARVDQPARQRAYGFSVQPGDAGRPVGGLGRSVWLAAQAGEKRIAAAAATRQKVGVVAAGGDDLASQAQHQRGVGVGPDRPPVAWHAVGQVVAAGRYQHDVHPALDQAAQVQLQRVQPQPTGLDLRGARRQRAKHHQGLRMLGDAVQRAGLAAAGFGTTQGVAQDHLARGDAVGVDMAGVAAHQTHQSAQLLRRVVKAPAAGPAIRARKHRAGAMLCAHALDFSGRQIKRLVPAHGHKFVVGVARAGPPVTKPRGTHHGLRNAVRRIGPKRHRMHDGRGRRVGPEGLDTHDAPAFNAQRVSAPMAAMGEALHGHVPASRLTKVCSVPSKARPHQPG